MTEQEFKEYNQAALKGTLKDELNPIFIFSMTSTSLLVDMLSNRLGPKALIRQELKNRGLDETGKYVGFK